MQSPDLPEWTVSPAEEADFAKPKGDLFERLRPFCWNYFLSHVWEELPQEALGGIFRDHIDAYMNRRFGNWRARIGGFGPVYDVGGYPWDDLLGHFSWFCERWLDIRARHISRSWTGSSDEFLAHLRDVQFPAIRAAASQQDGPFHEALSVAFKSAVKVPYFTGLDCHSKGYLQQGMGSLSADDFYGVMERWRSELAGARRDPAGNTMRAVAVANTTHPYPTYPTEPGGASKRGPKPDLEAALQVAKIVASVAPDGDWRSKWEEICEALDKEEIAYPRVWWTRRKWKRWADCGERSLAVKAIGDRLRLAGQRKNVPPETSA